MLKVTAAPSGGAGADGVLGPPLPWVHSAFRGLRFCRLCKARAKWSLCPLIFFSLLAGVGFTGNQIGETIGHVILSLSLSFYPENWDRLQKSR
jgi:hypothetical protein